MKQFHFFITAAIFLPAMLPAQDFLNGSFEQNGNLCLINTSATVFNANVKHTHAFGSFRKPDIASSDCGFGDAKDGNWFVGLATNVQGGITSEAMTMEISVPLVKGQQYSLSFWARSRSYAPNIQLGLSNADSAIGQVFYTVSAQSIGTEWTLVNIRFTAPENGKFLSVRAVNPNENSGVWLDGFHLGNIFVADTVVMPSVKKDDDSKSVGQTSSHRTDISNVGLFPNPSDGIFKVNADSTQLQSLTVYNMLGATITQHVATPDQPIPDKIDLTDQQPGLYFVQLAAVNGEKTTKRIIVSR